MSVSYVIDPTHDGEHERHQRCYRVVVIQQGQLVEVGRCCRLYQWNAHPSEGHRWLGEWHDQHLYLKRRGDIEAWLRKDGLI